MALQRHNSSQVVTFAPPPSWTFPATGNAGSLFPNSFTIATSNVPSLHIGDPFQLYTGSTLKEPTVFTIANIGADFFGNTGILFYPAPQVVVTASDTVTAVRVPPPRSARWLGAIGHVTSLKYSYALPGGPDQMSCLLQVPPDYRTDAINPGRVVKIFRGASEIWEGKLDEPQPATSGWTVSAHGAGTYGADFAAVYTTWNADDAVNQAISRGLRWVNPGIGSPAGIYLAQQQDSGAETITAHLNLITTGGALTWYVGRHNVLSVFPLPTVANRILVATSPVARTIAADINAIQLRYQVTADSGSKAATYATTSATVPASIAAHQRMEYYQDLSSAGNLTAAQAQAVGANILARYQRANYAGPFTAGPGQLLTLGGAPVDLGAEQAGTVCQLVVTDAGYGGEVVPGPVQFIVGGYEYDDETETATVTPFQSVGHDISTLISNLYPNNKY